MKNKLPIFVWLFSLVLFGASLAASIPALPDKVAAHFDATGAVNGWITRGAYLAFTGILGLSLSVFILVLAYAIRLLPAATLNVPRAGYWQLPENHSRACDYLFRHAFWVAA